MSTPVTHEAVTINSRADARTAHLIALCRGLPENQQRAREIAWETSPLAGFLTVEIINQHRRASGGDVGPVVPARFDDVMQEVREAALPILHSALKEEVRRAFN